MAERLANQAVKDNNDTTWHRPPNISDEQTGLSPELAERLSQLPNGTEFNPPQNLGSKQSSHNEVPEIAALAQQLAGISQTQQPQTQEQSKPPEMSPEERIKKEFEEGVQSYNSIKETIQNGPAKTGKWGQRRRMIRATKSADKQISRILKHLKGKEPDETDLKAIYDIVEKYMGQVSDPQPIAKAA